MALRHNSKISDNEPKWSSWIEKNRKYLPSNAFAEGDEDKKSTWSFPHHWVEGGEDTDGDGIWDDGEMYLHKEGLNAAWAAANGARSGKKASPDVIEHLRRHRMALGLEKGEKQSLSCPKTALNLGENMSGKLVFVDGDGEELPGKPFKMTVYSGEVIPNHWYWGNLAIDLDGIEIYRQQLPVLREHNPDRVVGYTTKIKVEEGKLVAYGYVLEDTEEGKEVISLSQKGFPWQASMYIPPEAIERVEGGQFALVNGKKLFGPGTVFRQATLRECSFCVLGADKHTDAQTFADKDNVQLNVEYFKNTVREEGMEIKTVAQLKEQYPELCKQLADEAVAQERQRIIDIQSAAFKGQDDLVLKLIKEGVATHEAIKTLNADFKTKLEEKKDNIIHQYKESNPPSVGLSDGDKKTKNPEQELNEAVENWLNNKTNNK